MTSLFDCDHSQSSWSFIQETPTGSSEDPIGITVTNLILRLVVAENCLVVWTPMPWELFVIECHIWSMILYFLTCWELFIGVSFRPKIGRQKIKVCDNNSGYNVWYLIVGFYWTKQSTENIENTYIFVLY